MKSEFITKESLGVNTGKARGASPQRGERKKGVPPFYPSVEGGGGYPIPGLEGKGFDVVSKERGRKKEKKGNGSPNKGNLFV